MAEPQEAPLVVEPQEARAQPLQRELPPEFQVLRYLVLSFLILVFQGGQTQVEAKSPTA